MKTMNHSGATTRRDAIKTLFFSSAAMGLNLQAMPAPSQIGKNGLHFLAIGDFGTGSADQKAVAAAMGGFVSKNKLTPDGLLMLGDNFYSTVKGGFTVDSDRWRTDIEDMYPPAVFPKPFYVVLGNHDYHDNDGGEKNQLGYAGKSGVRWTLPAKWYRADLGGQNPLLTLICLDSNLPSISGKGKHKATGEPLQSMTSEEEAAQLEWLERELEKPRAPFTIVMAHHPIYSNGAYGDTKKLVTDWHPLFQEHKVHAYLCGHDHDLQHLELEGVFTSHVLSGGGGASIRSLKNSKRKIPYGRGIHGFTHIHVQANSLSLTHYGVDGEAVHRFVKSPDGKVTIG